MAKTKRIMTQQGPTTTAIDLFSGAGGLTYGLRLAGITVGQAVESDKWAAETYSYNFPEVDLRLGDIRKIGEAEIRKWIKNAPDVLVGGPPCQGFSHSNTANKDPRDPRNSLFSDFVRFAAVLQPKVCLIENVKGLLVTANERGMKVIDIIRDSFGDIGYSCEYRLLDAANFGVPQHRERLFVVAIREDLKIAFPWPHPTHTPRLGTRTSMPLFTTAVPWRPFVTLWEAISDLPQITSTSTDKPCTYEVEPQNEFQQLMRTELSRNIHNHEPMRHTARIVDRFHQIGFGQSEKDVPQHLRPRQRGNPDECSGRAYSQNSRRQHPNEPCNTIVASSHTNFIHPFLHRNFTVREMLRIQSFPDSFVAKGKRAVLSHKLSQRKGLMDDIYLDQRMQIGNAVPPLLAREMGHSILAALREEATVCA